PVRAFAAPGESRGRGRQGGRAQDRTGARPRFLTPRRRGRDRLSSPASSLPPSRGDHDVKPPGVDPLAAITKRVVARGAAAFGKFEIVLVPLHELPTIETPRVVALRVPQRAPRAIPTALVRFPLLYP